MADAAGPVNPNNLGLPIVGGGVREKDPVCGMSVEPGAAAGKQEFGGRIYYFCSKRCAERFAAEPDRFLAVPGTAGTDAGHAVADGAAHASAAGAVSQTEPGAGIDVGSAGDVDSVAKTAKYTCPMHPQIVQIGPGACPICGMALEPMEVLAEAEADPEYASMSRRFWVSAALSVPL